MTETATHKNVQWIKANPWSERASRQDSRRKMVNNICQVRCRTLVSTHQNGVAPSLGEQWSEAYLDFNEARAKREIAIDESGILAWSALERRALRPNSGLRVKYSSGAVQYTPVQDAMGSPDLADVDYLETVEQADLEDGLDHLDAFKVVEAERRIAHGGAETTARAKHMASVIGVPQERLTAYVVSLLRRVPQENRMAHREDLEQAIWSKLWSSRDFIVKGRGDLWKVARIVMSGAYKDWYQVYANYRQLAVEAERRAMSLERAYARDQQADQEIGADLIDDNWLSWEDGVSDNIDLRRLFLALPERVRGLVEQRMNGTPITKKERTYLSQFLRGGFKKSQPSARTNKDIMLAVLKGTHVGVVVWYKQAR